MLFEEHPREASVGSRRTGGAALLVTQFAPVFQTCIKALSEHVSGTQRRSSPIEHSNLLCACVINCPTLNAAIAQTLLFIRAVDGPHAAASLHTTEHIASFSLPSSSPPDTSASFLLDFFEMAFYYKLFSLLVGEPLGAELTFAHARPVSDSILSAVVDCPIRFDGPENSMTFAARMLHRPNTLSPPDLTELLQTCPIPFIPLQAQPVSARLERLFRAALAANRPVSHFDQIARQYGRSGPTLRRHLAQEGTTFQALLNKCRMERAGELLGNTNSSIEQIAHKLCFSTASGFSRAFKGWTGLPPTTYRIRERHRWTSEDRVDFSPAVRNSREQHQRL
jgi:AraC-like DNA-binding protein